MANQAHYPSAYRVLGIVSFASILLATVYISSIRGSSVNFDFLRPISTYEKTTTSVAEYYVPEREVNTVLAPVVMTMVMIGETSALEGLGALKSVLMYLSRPLELHLVCSSEVPEMVDRKMALISRCVFSLGS